MQKPLRSCGKSIYAKLGFTWGAKNQDEMRGKLDNRPLEGEDLDTLEFQEVCNFFCNGFEEYCDRVLEDATAIRIYTLDSAGKTFL